MEPSPRVSSISRVETFRFVIRPRVLLLPVHLNPTKARDAAYESRIITNIKGNICPSTSSPNAKPPFFQRNNGVCHDLDEFRLLRVEDWGVVRGVRKFHLIEGDFEDFLRRSIWISRIYERFRKRFFDKYSVSFDQLNWYKF